MSVVAPAPALKSRVPSCKSWHGHLLPYFPWVISLTSLSLCLSMGIITPISQSGWKQRFIPGRCSINVDPFPLLECSDIMTVCEHEHFDPCFSGLHVFAYCWCWWILLALLRSLLRSWNPHLLWKLVGAELEGNPLGMEKEQLCSLRCAADVLRGSPPPPPSLVTSWWIWDKFLQPLELLRQKVSLRSSATARPS